MELGFLILWLINNYQEFFPSTMLHDVQRAQHWLLISPCW